MVIYSIFLCKTIKALLISNDICFQSQIRQQIFCRRKMLDQLQKKYPFKIKGYKWQTRQQIGRSPNSITYKVPKQTQNIKLNQLVVNSHRFVAIRKFVFPRIENVEELYQKFVQELRKIKNIQSPYLVQYLDQQVYKKGGYLVMELCECDLETYMERYQRKIPDRVAQTIVNSIVKVVEELRDNLYHPLYLNPKNFLIKDRIVKFSPIGSGMYYVDENDISQTSAPLYLAPEIVLDGFKEMYQNDYCAEIWSIGMIAYELALGILPFNFHNWDIYKNRINQQGICLNFKIKAPASFMDFARMCLVKNPKYRMTWQEIMKHSIIHTYDKGIEDTFEYQVFSTVNGIFKIPIDQIPQVAAIWSQIKKAQESETKPSAKFKFDISSSMKYLLKIMKYSDVEQIKDIFKEIHVEGLQKHQLNSKFKQFKLDQDNQYVTLWKLAKNIKKKKIDIYKISEKFDFNKNRQIDYSEIKSLFNSVLPNIRESTIGSVWNSMKEQYNGSISTNNMLKQLLKHLLCQQDDMKKRAYESLRKLQKVLYQNGVIKKQIFEYFDTDKDNRLCIKEFSRLYNSLVGYQRQQEINIMFKIIVKNSNGNITLKQLRDFCHNFS